MKGKTNQRTRIAVCTFPVATEDGRIQLFPAGVFDAPRGSMEGEGPWKIDAIIADRLIKRVAARSNDIVIDYEHQTLSAVENGKEAPAAGWVTPTTLEWKEGHGLYAAASWTKKAQGYIDSSEYRYLSPVFSYSQKTGEVLDLLHIALTNNPAVDGMQAVSSLAAAKFNLTQNEESKMDALLKLFGLAEDAGETEVLAVCTALQTKVTTLEADLTKKDEAIAAAKAATPNDAVEAMQALQTEVAALKTANQAREVSDLIDVAMSEGKLLPAQQSWAENLGKSDIAALKSYLDTAQPVAALKGSQTQGKAPAGLTAAGELDDAAIAVCKQMGIKPEDYKKTLQEEQAN